MPSWLIPALLFAAQTRPTRQESVCKGPRCVSRATASSSGCAFVVGPRGFGCDRRSDQLDVRLRGSKTSVYSPRWRGGGSSSSSSSRPRPRRRRRVQETMDIDGPLDVGGGDGKKGMTVRDEVLLQQDAAAVASKPTVELPGVRAPVDLPQPGEWLQVPPLGGMTDSPLQLNSQVPSTGLKVENGNGKDKADPFAVPDNDYADSFLDSLWINLLSSRMAVAVEAEAFNVKGKKESVAGNGIGSGSARAKASTKGNGFTKSVPAGAAAGSASEEEARRMFSMTRPPGGGMGGGYTYDDYVALATRLQAGAPERQREVVRGVLRSVFPEWFPAFYRTLFPPSKFSAQVNAFMCPPLFGWLVGKSELTDGVVDIEAMQGRGPSQEVWRNTVKVERCRYLEASKCKGTCMNLCKLPTEAFFREDLGMPLRMTPNFEDLSCEFAFGQDALPAEEDPLMQEPCWTECLSSGKQPRKPQRACHTMPESPLRGP